MSDWETARHTPVARVSYHDINFRKATQTLGEFTKDLAARGYKMDARMIDLAADTMVKCFDQLLTDVKQGFPGYGPAVWQRKPEKPSLVKMFMDQNRAELIKIRDNTAEYDWLVYMDNLLENEPYNDKDIFGVLGSLLLTYDNLPDDCVDEKTIIDYMIIELNHSIVELYDI